MPLNNGLGLSIYTLVLLFSVAAAATAASLLTGSSEPILSSGLASNPTADSTMNSVSLPSSPSPPSAGDTATSTGENTPAPSPFRPVRLSPRFSTSSVSSATAIPPRILNNYVNPLSAASHIPSPYTQSPITGMNDESSAGRAERIRQAWSMIRERLRLQGNNVSSISSSTPSLSPSALSPLSAAVSGTSVISNSGNVNLMDLPLPSSTPIVIGATSNVGVDPAASTLSPSATANVSGRDRTLNGRSGDLREGAGRARERTLRDDTREHMLAEMTRVFNNGLGLGPNTSTSAEDFRSISSHRSGERELPPEGSFERFLVELQTELRVALTPGVQDENGQNGDREEGEVQRQQGREAVSAETQDSSQGETVIEGENESRSLGPLELVEEVTEQDVLTDDDMPSLQNVSNNSSSEDVNHGSYLFPHYVLF